MQVSVSGKGVEIGASLREHVETKVDEHVNKYIDRVNSIQVIVSREAHMFRVDIHGNVGTHSGVVVRSQGDSGEVYSAFDIALERCAKQLRRYKRKITDHHNNEVNERRVKATKYILPPEVGVEEEKQESVVIAETATDVETLTVSQAVMKMDLQHLPALMFFNSKHGRLNVVYRREDGNISWVDPETSSASAAA